MNPEPCKRRLSRQAYQWQKQACFCTWYKQLPSVYNTGYKSGLIRWYGNVCAWFLVWLWTLLQLNRIKPPRYPRCATWLRWRLVSLVQFWGAVWTGCNNIGSLFPLTCFPDLTFSLISDEYQIQILSSLRKVNADYHQVGWYQSAYLGTHLNRELLESHVDYQTAIHESIVLIYGKTKIVKLIKFISIWQALSCIFYIVLSRPSAHYTW